MEKSCRPGKCNILILAVAAFFGAALVIFASSCEQSPGAPSIGRPVCINLDYNGSTVNVYRDNPHYDRVVDAVEEALQQNGSLDHIVTDESGGGFRLDEPGQDIFLMLFYSHPVQLNFIQEETDFALIKLPVTVFMEGGLAEVVDELLRRKSGIDFSLTAELIDAIHIYPFEEYPEQKVELSTAVFVQFAAAFSELFLAEPPGEYRESNVFVEVDSADGRKYIIADFAGRDLLQVTYYSEIAGIGVNTLAYATSPILADLLRSYFIDYFQ